MRGAANVTCRHRNMPTQTATCTPRDTQADSRTGAAGHTHTGTREGAGYRCTVELRGVGHTHGRPRAGRATHEHTHAQGNTEILSHSGARRSHCHKHACTQSVAHSCTITKDPVTHRHTCAHITPVTQTSSPAVTAAVTEMQLHINTCTQLSNKYFPGFLLCGSGVLYTAKLLLLRKLNSPL